MRKHSTAIAMVLALVSAACSDDEGESAAQARGGSAGTGGSAASGGTGGTAGGGAGGSAGTPDCSGTQTTDEKFSQAMKVLRDIMAERKIPGGALAVIKGGKLVNLGVAGSKRASVCDPITPDTIFPLGAAASPLLTVLAALDAVEEGKLSLAAPITDVLPTLTVTNGNASDITLHHLLSYGGNYSADNLAGSNQGSACAASLAGAFANPTKPVLKGRPGKISHYMFTDMELGALALETAGGVPFVQAVTKRVLGPLSMGGGYDPAALLASDHTLVHLGTAELELDADGDCPNHDPVDGYHGSIRDAVKLAEYLTGGAGSILEPARLDAVLSKQGPSFWSMAHMTYGGFGINHPDLGGEFIIVDNLSLGFNTEIRFYKQRRLAVITLVNSSNFGTGGLYTSQWSTTRIGDAVATIYDPSLTPFLDIAPHEYQPDPASLPSLAATYKDPVGHKGTGPRTLVVSVDPADPTKLIGSLTASGGASDAVSFTGNGCADNFQMKVGGQEYTVRFWRDDAGQGWAVLLLGPNGPAFYREP